MLTCGQTTDWERVPGPEPGPHTHDEPLGAKRAAAGPWGKAEATPHTARNDAPHVPGGQTSPRAQKQTQNDHRPTLKIYETLRGNDTAENMGDFGLGNNCFAGAPKSDLFVKEPRPGLHQDELLFFQRRAGAATGGRGPLRSVDVLDALLQNPDALSTLNQDTNHPSFGNGPKM